jgi:hypothetical protein
MSNQHNKSHDDSRLDSQDSFNFEDSSLAWIKKCYWPDTVEGTLFLNGIVYLLNALPNEVYWYMFPIRLVVEALDIAGIITGFSESAYAFEIFLSRIDLYNPFILVGKLIKFVL